MITVGAVSLGWSGVPLERVLADLREMGGESIEINSQAGLHGLVIDGATAPRVRSMAETAGIAIRAVSGYNDFAQTEPGSLEREVRRLLAACRIASDLGVTLVRAFAGEAKPGRELTELRARIVEGFRRAAGPARAAGVTLAIENHGRLLNDGRALAELVREVDEPNVRLTLDTGNFAWGGHDLASTREDLDAALPYAVNVQIKDGIWRDGTFQFVPAGDGELPLAELVARLVACGYDGPISSEYEGGGDFREGTRRSITRLRAERDAAVRSGSAHGDTPGTPGRAPGVAS
ncbi:MAG: sugar phosphate isomerase/epimerase [Chloroflexi bacterium]|nr:sugar phosphate isomerase/epimerase [Chloroflexota bacterium]